MNLGINMPIGRRFCHIVDPDRFEVSGHFDHGKSSNYNFEEPIIIWVLFGPYSFKVRQVQPQYIMRRK